MSCYCVYLYNKQISKAALRFPQRSIMLDAIKTFIEVAADGNFTAVARRHDLAASSVARKIDMLEAGLGVKLLTRSSRAIRLTDAGEQFLPRARNIVAEMDDARQELADLQASPSGRLTITAPTAFGRRHVVPAIASFLRLYPLIDIELHLSDQRVDLMVQRIDVAVRIGILPDSELIATQLAPVKRLVCASQDYLDRHGRPATPEQLLDHNCLSYASSPLPPGWWRFPGVNRNVPLAVQGSLKTDDAEALLAAALAGIGIVHLPSWLISEVVAAGKLIVLFPDNPAAAKLPQPAIHAVRMPGRSHTAKAQLFIAHLKSCLGSPPYWDAP